MTPGTADGFPGLETAPVSSAADVESAWTGRREEEEHEAELKRTQAKRPLWRRFGGEILCRLIACRSASFLLITENSSSLKLTSTAAKSREPGCI
jgi:hypothetical protein